MGQNPFPHPSHPWICKLIFRFNFGRLITNSLTIEIHLEKKVNGDFDCAFRSQVGTVLAFASHFFGTSVSLFFTWRWLV